MAELDLQSTLPPEVYAQQQALNRQQQMAAALMQQGQQPQGQMISGHYVAPSFFQNIAPVANMLTGAYLQNKGDEKALALADQIRKGREAEKQAAVQLIKENKPVDILTLTNDYGGVTPFLGAATKVALPEPTPEERRYKAAIADGSFKGGFNAFINQLSEKDKQSLALERARLGLAQREQAWNMGMPISGVGGGGAMPQAPLRTINPGSPVLAPNQAMPSQMPQAMPGQMPAFNSKPEQELWLAKQKKLADLQADAYNALPGAQLKVQTALGAINNMIGDTKVDEKGNLVLGEKKPHAGFYEAVGMPSITNAFGLTGIFPGSDVQDFKTEFNKVGGSAFLQAVETLRGTGAISETEGKKATDAVTSMSLAQSEKAFVKAANEFRDAINKGYVASQQRAGVVPFNPLAQPTAPNSAQPKLRYNLQTNQWE